MGIRMFENMTPERLHWRTRLNVARRFARATNRMPDLLVSGVIRIDGNKRKKLTFQGSYNLIACGTSKLLQIQLSRKCSHGFLLGYVSAPGQQPSPCRAGEDINSKGVVRIVLSFRKSDLNG